MSNIFEWLLSASGVKVVIQLCRFVDKAIENNLQARVEELARGTRTASTLRIGRVPLRWYEWSTARALQRGGRGSIHEGHYEAWVDTVPPALQQAMAMRARYG